MVLTVLGPQELRRVLKAESLGDCQEVETTRAGCCDETAGL